MKYLLMILFILGIVWSCPALSTQEIIQLSKLNTSDKLLLDLIQSSKLDHPVTPQEVILLKEAGVSEQVIQYLLKISNPETAKLPQQEGESTWISDSMRVYQTRDKSGKVIRVVTNLDEKGQRSGGEVPSEPSQPEERYPEYVPDEPREIYVTVRQDDSRERDYGSTGEMAPGYGGIPIYSGGYYPFYSSGYYQSGFCSGSFFPRFHSKPNMRFHGITNRVTWQAQAHRPQVRTPISARPRITTIPHSAGSRPLRIRN
jgi:hypothetical protein